jgi:hypothetical protein
VAPGQPVEEPRVVFALEPTGSSKAPGEASDRPPLAEFSAEGWCTHSGDHDLDMAAT